MADDKQSYDALLTETIARHFAAATVTDGVIDLGLRGLRMRCRVDSLRPAGAMQAAAGPEGLWASSLRKPAPSGPLEARSSIPGRYVLLVLWRITSKRYSRAA